MPRNRAACVSNSRNAQQQQRATRSIQNSAIQMCSFVIDNTSALDFRPAGERFAEASSPALFVLKTSATAALETFACRISQQALARFKSTAFRNSLDPSPPHDSLPHLPPPHDRLYPRTQWPPSQSLLRQRRSTLCSRVRPPFSANACRSSGDATRLLTRGSSNSVPPVARDAPDAHQVSDFGILVVRLSRMG